jgi:hypothetical protein
MNTIVSIRMNKKVLNLENTFIRYNYRWKEI